MPVVQLAFYEDAFGWGRRASRPDAKTRLRELALAWAVRAGSRGSRITHVEILLPTSCAFGAGGEDSYSANEGAGVFRRRGRRFRSKDNAWHFRGFCVSEEQLRSLRSVLDEKVRLRTPFDFAGLPAALLPGGMGQCFGPGRGAEPPPPPPAFFCSSLVVFALQHADVLPKTGRWGLTARQVTPSKLLRYVEACPLLDTANAVNPARLRDAARHALGR